MVTVAVNGINNVVAIDPLTLAKTAKKAVQVIDVERHDYVLLNAGNIDDEYVVQRIVSEKNDHKRTNYSLRWHSYRRAGNPLEPAHHVA